MPTVTAQALVTASDLKRQRGWTESLLTQLLRAPDALGPNPHGFRAPQRFFRADRALEAEADAAFLRRVEQLGEPERWRREQPTRTYVPDEVHRLEWLDDPRRIRLFLAPRRPRVRRPRRELVAPTAPTPGMRWEVLTLF